MVNSSKGIWEVRQSRNGGRRPVVFVSASVYDKQDLLEQLFMLLRTQLKYDVRMSYKGTIPVSWTKSAFRNCEDAVDASDLFIGIISPFYGSGVDGEQMSITEREMRRARDRQIPRIMLVDERVVFLRTFLNGLGFKNKKGRARFREILDGVFNEKDVYLRSKRICDLRTLDLYDEMILGVGNDDNIPVEKRIGNWVQPFRDMGDFKRYISEQFSYIQMPEVYNGTAKALEAIREKLPEMQG